MSEYCSRRLAREGRGRTGRGYVVNIEKPPKHSLWRYKTMGIYRVVGIANEGTTHPRKYPESVVYAGIRDKKLWVRRLDDWYQVMTRVDGGESS